MSDRLAAMQRVIRVFVSSTFQDMQAERDELVKRAFPALHNLCSKRGVTWGEIDLRWGVTSVEKAEGKVLPICLEEIRRCRPYFIGILGERYGWIPNEIPNGLIEREPWLRDHLKQSVTELEILHGVLNNPEMAEYAFFYFRDPHYLDLMQRAQRDEYASRDAESIEKLHRLKQSIRHSKFPVRENYASPRELGKLVLADLTAVIDSLFPEGSTPNALEREAAEHEAFARSRSSVYIGRPFYFETLDQHASGDGAPLVVLGESGSGKSALLANWALRRRDAHPEELLVLQFIGSAPASSDWAAMLRRIMGEFKRRFDIEEDIPNKPDELRLAFANWLSLVDNQMSRWIAQGDGQLQKLAAWARRMRGKRPTPRRLVLVLDALNQLEDREGARELVWLPPSIPPRIRLVVSTLPGRTLEELTIRNWPTLTVQPLDVQERQQFIEAYLWQYSKKLEPEHTKHMAAAEAASNPLYLRGVLEELRQFGSHEGLNARVTYYLQAKNPIDLYGLILRRWEEDYGEHLVRDSMSLVWGARRGLSEAELLQCLGSKERPLPRAEWSPLFLASAESLVSRAGLLSFFHDYLREAVRKTYVNDSDAEHRVHRRLADYFRGTQCDARQLDELPWQLSQAGEWKLLYDLLLEEQFFDAAWDADSFEVKARWAQLEAQSAFTMKNAYQGIVDDPSRFDPNYVWSLAILLNDAGYVSAALRLAAHVLDYTRGSADKKALATALGSMAVILQMRGQLDEAMKLHEAEERICRGLNDKEGLQRSLGNQALILQTRSKFDEAMTLHKEEEALCLETNSDEGLQRSFGNQALILTAKGDLQRAMTLYRKQEHICLQLGNKQGLANALSGQAIVLRAQGEYHQAMELHKREEKICRELGNKHGLAVSLGNQAILMRLLGNLDEALQTHKEEERLSREQQNDEGLAVSLGNQALVHFERKDYEQALQLHKEEARLCRKLGNTDGVQTSLLNQGTVLQRLGKLDDALSIYGEVEQTYRNLGILEGLAITLVNQAWVLGLERNEISSALVLADQAFEIASRAGYTALAAEIKSVQMRIKAKQGQH